MTKKVNKQKMPRIPVTSGANGKVIGAIVDRTFIMKYWKMSKHFCRLYKAIGIDGDAFSGWILPLADSIVVKDNDSGDTYTISVEDFYSKCIFSDLGWGTQLFCRLEYWERTPATEPPSDKEPVAV